MLDLIAGLNQPLDQLRFVDAFAGRELRASAVGVRIEELCEHDRVGKGAAHREGVAYYGPLGLSKAAEQLAQVVDESGQDEPPRPAISPQRLGGLQGVVDLRQLDIRIALVDDRTHPPERLPDAH